MKLRPFEIGLIVFFAVTAVAGIITVSIFQSKPSQEAQMYGDRVTIWGTFPQSVMDEFLNNVTNETKELNVVSYTQIDERTFDETLVNAIAEGNSPDLIIIPHTLLVKHRAKLTPITSELITEREFRDTYIDGASIFRLSDGTYGIPFAVDPMVMYWNRDMFSSSGLATPPKTWEQLVDITIPALTKMDTDRNIFQSAIAFGGYDNVTHAKETIALLSLQAGSTLVTEQDKKYTVTFGGDSEDSVAQKVFSFYTQFALPSSALYTWNKSRPNDLDAFSDGTLGMYFGQGSEWHIIQQKNPNLNYDVVQVPQGEGVNTLRTYGTFYAFAIPRASQKAQGAYAVAQLFASPKYAEQLIKVNNFAPVLRSLIVAQNDPVDFVRYQSALYTYGWLDPSPIRSDEVFRQAVNEAVGGNVRAKQIVSDVVSRLEKLF